MIQVDSIKYMVHCFLNKQNIMHYCKGVYKYSKDFDCLVFCLQGQKTIKDVYDLFKSDDIKVINVIYSQKSDTTYLEVLF